MCEADDRWREIADDLFAALRAHPIPVPQQAINAMIAYEREREGRR